jgi:hypothetical protein
MRCGGGQSLRPCGRLSPNRHRLRPRHGSGCHRLVVLTGCHEPPVTTPFRPVRKLPAKSSTWPSGSPLTRSKSAQAGNARCPVGLNPSSPWRETSFRGRSKMNVDNFGFGSRIVLPRRFVPACRRADAHGHPAAVTHSAGVPPSAEAGGQLSRTSLGDLPCSSAAGRQHPRGVYRYPVRGATETETETGRRSAGHLPITATSVCAGRWRRMRDLNPRGL